MSLAAKPHVVVVAEEGVGEFLVALVYGDGAPVVSVVVGGMGALVVVVVVVSAPFPGLGPAPEPEPPRGASANQ